MKIISSYILIFAIYSCASSNLSDSAKLKMILGKWNISNKSTQQIFTQIEFTKEGAIFKTTADTILFFSYEFRPKNILMLRDKNHEVYLNQIMKLGKNSIIFRNLLYDTTNQIYLRER